MPAWLVLLGWSRWSPVWFVLLAAALAWAHRRRLGHVWREIISAELRARARTRPPAWMWAVHAGIGIGLAAIAFLSLTHRPIPEFVSAPLLVLLVVSLLAGRKKRPDDSEEA